MSYTETAAALHGDGCNCCQAVIMSCCENYGLTQQQAYALGAFFGGGMRSGEVCGAVSGCLMGLGLKYGDQTNRQCRKANEFEHLFQENFGSLLCREILAKHEKKLCPALIEFAAKYLEDELK